MNKKYTIEDSNHIGEVIVSWIITHSCQEHCGYCISPCKKKEITSKKDHFTIQEKLLIGGLTKNRFIGGEPLLISHLDELIKDSYEKGFDTRLSSNGILLTESRFNNIKDYLNSVAFPFESLNDDLNKTIRGVNEKKHREIITSRIKMVKEVGNIGILINTCVHKENINELKYLGNLLTELKIDHWKLRMFSFASGRGAVPNKTRFEISKEDFITTVSNLQKQFPSLKIDGRLPSKLNSRLMISPQGDLYRMVDSTTITYGNMLTDTLNIKEIYENNNCN